MKFSAFIALVLAPLALAAALPEADPAAEVDERALPPGHPILGPEDFPANFTFGPELWPAGFTAPTETITALPVGYSVGPTAVYGPDGAPVTAFPEAAVKSVEKSGAARSTVSSLFAVTAVGLGVALL